MTRYALRAYTVLVAALCAGAIAFALQQEQLAERAHAETSAWQSLAREVLVRERAALQNQRAIALRYDALVRRTNRSQKQLLAAVDRARRAVQHAAVQSSLAAATPAVVTAAASPVPVVTPAPPVPTTTSSPHP